MSHLNPLWKSTAAQSIFDIYLSAEKCFGFFLKKETSVPVKVHPHKVIKICQIYFSHMLRGNKSMCILTF